MAKYSEILLLSAFFFCLLEIGTAKLCFSCTTLKNDKCADPFNLPTTETVSCDETGYGCMKQILPAAGGSSKIVHRGCTPKFYCSTLSSASEHCTVCDVEYCNSSSVLGPSLAVGLFVLVKTWIGF
ncbi:hypothetical protein RN001_013382 [Aquatica leii]|uniref:Protein sleepless n=1 Tax=Aquatica leii TaxID=1421715 RepID=A0AAN7SCD3_9COLE|nr:hypothetical protein RN001_013382 [Aquatica leii]